jgi:hypothetical protein
MFFNTIAPCLESLVRKIHHLLTKALQRMKLMRREIKETVERFAIHERNTIKRLLSIYIHEAQLHV